MKKVIHFSRYIIPAVILSAVLILSGLFPLFTRGVNFGIDFKPGLVEEVRIVPAAIELNYTGSATIAVEVNPEDISLIISGVGADNTTLVYPYTQYATVESLVAAVSSVEGLTASVVTPGAATKGLFVNSAVSSVLTSEPYRLYTAVNGQLATVEQVREILSSLEDVSVKVAGSGVDEVYQIRIGDNSDGTGSISGMQNLVTDTLGAAFGTANIAVIKTDFIGAQYSNSLIVQSILLVAAALFLIWIYATIRFKWDFALASVIAIIHDALIIISFIVWTQMEFSTTTLAAVLTIIGYGINDTVVVLDRIRENSKVMNTKNFMDIVNQSQSDCLGRTMITTITTLLAVISLWVFTSGSIHDFALALIVGMISSAYSTIMITSAFLAVTRRNWKPSDEVKNIPVYSEDVVQFPSGK